MPSNTELRHQLYTFLTTGEPAQSGNGMHGGTLGRDKGKRDLLAGKVADSIAGVFEGNEVTAEQVVAIKTALGDQLKKRTREDFAAAFGAAEDDKEDKTRQQGFVAVVLANADIDAPKKEAVATAPVIPQQQKPVEKEVATSKGYGAAEVTAMQDANRVYAEKAAKRIEKREQRQKEARANREVPRVVATTPTPLVAQRLDHEALQAAQLGQRDVVSTPPPPSPRVEERQQEPTTPRTIPVPPLDMGPVRQQQPEEDEGRQAFQQSQRTSRSAIPLPQQDREEFGSARSMQQAEAARETTSTLTRRGSMSGRPGTEDKKQPSTVIARPVGQPSITTLEAGMAAAKERARQSQQPQQIEGTVTMEEVQRRIREVAEKRQIGEFDPEAIHQKVQQLNTKTFRGSRSGNLEDALDKSQTFEDYQTALDDAGKRADTIGRDHANKTKAHSEAEAIIKEAEAKLSSENTSIRDVVTVDVLRKRARNSSSKDVAPVDDNQALLMFEGMSPKEKRAVEKEINAQVAQEKKKIQDQLADLKGESVSGKLSNFLGTKPKLDEAAVQVQEARKNINELRQSNETLMRNCDKILKSQADLVEGGNIEHQGTGWLESLKRTGAKMRASVLAKFGDNKEYYQEKLEDIKAYEKNIDLLEKNKEKLKEQAKSYDKAESAYMDASKQYQKALDGQRNTLDQVKSSVARLTSQADQALLMRYNMTVSQMKEQRQTARQNVDALVSGLTGKPQTKSSVVVVQQQGQSKAQTPRVKPRGEGMRR